MIVNALDAFGKVMAAGGAGLVISSQRCWSVLPILRAENVV